MFAQGGDYSVITEIVRTDPYLDLELRGSTGVIIYYRGGKLLTINETNGLIGLDKKYYHGNESHLLEPKIDNIHDYIHAAKGVIDLYEYNGKNKLGEKEIQQRIVYENNRSVNSDKTDYFIADIEWADNNKLGGRADIVAFRWDHTLLSHKRRNIQLTLIEVKQGENAIRTVETTDRDGKTRINPGLRKHYEDYQSLLTDEKYVQAFIKDMQCVLRQKYELELVNGLDKLYYKGETEIDPVVDNQIDFIFLLANYHHYSKELSIECESLPDDCKFYVSSLMGYGLYSDFVYEKKALKQLFPKLFSK